MFHDEQLLDTVSDIAGPSEGGKPGGWIYGVIAALPLFSYGLYCLLTQHALFFAIGSQIALNRVPRRGLLFEVYDGRLAMSLGLLLITVALYLHFQYFWSQSPRLFRYYEIGRLLAILIFIAAIGWWIYEFAHKFF